MRVFYSGLTILNIGLFWNAVVHFDWPYAGLAAFTAAACFISAALYRRSP